MTPDQFRIAEKWLTEYAPRCDRKLSPAHGNAVRGLLRCLTIAHKHVEAGMSYPEAMCKADWDIWTERSDLDAMAAACFFWAIGNALQGKEFVR